MTTQYVICMALAVGVSGCAIHQTVKPVARFEEKQICIVESPNTRAGFLDSYKRVLSSKGYAVRVLPASASVSECPIVSTYTANWRWDLAIYLVYAEIKVFSAGNAIGEATYDSRGGGANMGKFVDADRKIAELVNELFPGTAQ
ncbi:MAG: hypothetical protein K8S25_05655 [Alphaproteobacteria bacterium]|nr:hypothetical protein [Alphaproteobacteria bacterium]